MQPLVLGLSRSRLPTQRGRKIKYSHPFPDWMEFTPRTWDERGKVPSNALMSSYFLSKIIFFSKKHTLTIYFFLCVGMSKFRA